MFSLLLKGACNRVRAIHYSHNECPHFCHYLHEKMQKVSDCVDRCGEKSRMCKTDRTQIMSVENAVNTVSEN